MPANTSPIFPIEPVCAMTQVDTANSLRNGTGPMNTIFSAGPNGTRVDRIVVIAQGTTSVGTVRLFIGDDSGIPTVRLYAEIAVSAITVSATQRAFTTTLVFDRGLILPPGFTLRASTEKAEVFNIIAHAANY